MMQHVRPLWAALDLPPSFLSRLTLGECKEPVVNSSFKLGSAAQSAIELAGLSAAYLHYLRTGVEQDVYVNARHAVLEFKSEALYTLHGKPPPGDLWDDIAGMYKCKDNRHLRIHTNFPHHRQGILDILSIPPHVTPTHDTISKALFTWDAFHFEEVAGERGMCAFACRSFAEWDAHPQGRALASVPPVTLVKVGEAPKRSAKMNPSRPLDGIRVLDLSRVLAGPVCGRTLAAHGADVILVTSPNLPALPVLDADTSRGKRTTQLDLLVDQDRRKLDHLVQDCDVFMQAYRPGGLANKGFGVADVVQRRPGIVYASINAWGWNGPWKDRRGFDSLVQTASGFNDAEGKAYSAYAHTEEVPRALPMQALDHAAGYMLAYGINTALCKTITEGGSWEVRVSLAGIGRWIRRMGQLEPHDGFNGVPIPSRDDPETISVRNESGGGISAIKHAAVLSKTPVREGGRVDGLNAHEPKWL